MKNLRNVTTSDVESIAIQHILETQYGNILKTYDNIKWALYDNIKEIPEDWHIVSNFEIRDRIVEPPIIGLEYIQYKIVNKIKILAYC